MKRATTSNYNQIIEILSKAFDENRSVNYVVGQGKNKEQRIRKLMEYSLKVCNAFGEVWLSDDERACALVLFPDKKKTNWRTVLWDITLALSVIGLSRVVTIMKREALIKGNHPKEPFCYLWFIGVDPECHGNGIGSELLKALIERFDQADRPIYLETSVETNLPWYKKAGFEIYGELSFSYKLYLLRRPATR
jgi:ribosomal protein S18 acetylase RimI-like enzyme